MNPLAIQYTVNALIDEAMVVFGRRATNPHTSFFLGMVVEVKPS